jgi:hypothetical protein
MAQNMIYGDMEGGQKDALIYNNDTIMREGEDILMKEDMGSYADALECRCSTHVHVHIHLYTYICTHAHVGCRCSTNLFKYTNKIKY